MKRIELSDEAYAALQQLAATRNLSESETLAALLGAGSPAQAGDHLQFYLHSPGFTSRGGPVERYLALLEWVARHYTSEFSDFISHQESGRRYLSLNREEINEARAHNLARPLAGTHYWAVLTIDDAAKRRFICRLLEFIGCPDETGAAACRALGLGEAEAHIFRLLSA